jgi:hypothetical protein
MQPTTKNRVYPLPVKTCRFLRGIFRYGLAHVPKLDDAVALEFENVNYGRSQLARFLPRAWINRHQIPIFERALDLQHLVRIPGFVFLQSQTDCAKLWRKCLLRSWLWIPVYLVRPQSIRKVIRHKVQFEAVFEERFCAGE